MMEVRYLFFALENGEYQSVVRFRLAIFFIAKIHMFFKIYYHKDIKCSNRNYKNTFYNKKENE